jgi:integrase
MSELRQREGIGARALEFTILTASRTGEALGARFSEIDLDRKLWTVPADRMKGGREHRVPLTPRALAIVKDMAAVRLNEFVFPGMKQGRSLSDMALLMLLRDLRPGLTVHGFRSTFKDWAAECTNAPNFVSEAALAHAVADKVEGAYRRGDLFEKRRKLIATWGEFCARKPTEVVSLPRLSGRTS